MEDPRPFVSSQIFSFQLMLSKFELDGDLNPNFSPGQFELYVSSIKVTQLLANVTTGTKLYSIGNPNPIPITIWMSELLNLLPSISIRLYSRSKKRNRHRDSSTSVQLG